MKTMVDNSVFNFQGFEVLSENEMTEVRGGGDIPPRTRQIEIIIEDGE